MVNDSNIITINSIESKMKVNKVSGNHKQETIKGIQILEDTNKGITGWGFDTNPTGLGLIKETNYLRTKACSFKVKEPVSSWKFIYRNIDLSKLKHNTTYTVQVDVKTNYSENITIVIEDKSSANKVVDFGYINDVNGERRLKLVGTTNDVPLENQVLYILPSNIGYSTDRELIITNIILVEGDYSDRELEWEDFTNLEGSPSIGYPSYVRAVGDNVNILPNNAVSTSHNGVNYTINEDGSIYAVGTATSNSQVILAGQMSSTEEIMKLRKGVQYKNVGNVDIIYRDTNLDYARLQEGNILTVDENVSVGCFYLQVNSGTTVDETYYPKLVEYYEGMDESYSPYGQGSVEVKKINKNYYDVGKSINDYFVTAGSKGATITQYNASNYVECDIIEGIRNIETYNSSGWNWIAKWLKINKNTNYTISLNKSTTSLTVLGFNSVETGITGDVIAELSSANSKTTFNSGNYEYYAVSFYPPAGLEIAIQVEAGDLNTNFEEHQEQSYILDIQKTMLSGDYFIKETDGWKEVHIWEKDVLTGNENIVYYNAPNAEKANTFDTAYFTIQPSKNGMASGEIGTVNSNMFKNIYSANGIWGSTADEVEESIAIDTTIRIRVNKTRLTGYTNDLSASEKVELFKQLLQQKNTEGNPVYAYYRIVTPTKLACTEEQITVLNELQNIILYDDTTNIVLPDIYPILDYDVSKIIDTTTTFEASLDSNGYFVVPDYDIKCLVSYSESDIPSMPEAVETAVSVPGRDGDIPLNTTYNPIPFNIVCYTEDNLTPEEKYAEETKMNKFLNSIKNNTIKLKLESKGKYYDVKYNGQLTTINYPKHLQFNIPLKSSSSYAKDIEEYYILGNGEKESDTIKEVGAVFVIEGPAQTPKISLNDYEMFYDNVLLSNTKLVIDSNKSTVTMINREGTATNAMRYYNHEFPKIQNGNNVLKVLSGIDEDRQVNVRWFDLKL